MGSRGRKFHRKVAAARGPIYIVAFHDRYRDGHLGNGEYDFLVLRFGG